MKDYDVVVTSHADCDLAELFDYVSTTLSAPNAASSLVTRLKKIMISLSNNPLRCPLAKDTYLAKQGFRTLFTGKYIIIYVVDERESRVIIHRVLYAKRNYLRLFNDAGQVEF